ncbi:MAG: chromate resistance protein ChrB domain-containing protein [Candidatus Eisenbacteria bacterium]
MTSTPDPKRPRPWVLLFHHLPAKPDYLRVRIGRELRALGALAIKNSVYVVADTPALREGLLRIAHGILECGGEAVVSECGFLAGLPDAVLADRFRTARDAEYAEIGAAAAKLTGALRGRRSGAEVRRRVGRAFERLQRRFEEVRHRDPLGAPGRERCAGDLSLVEDLLHGIEDPGRPPATVEPPRGAVWVTRSGVMVDRIASAWLIRRAIDPRARFKFVSGHGYRPSPGELRFDMARAEFTHQDGRCTFETLLERFRLHDPALHRIGEIVHDLDLGEGRHHRPESSGVGRMVFGIALRTAEDTERLRQGATVFEGLYESFRNQEPAPATRPRATRGTP